MIPILSIIIPIYRIPENVLKFCIDSVLNQTYKNLELILVDDGNVDFIPTLCDKYASQDQRVKVIHQENKGVSNARNNGLRNAQGDYIMFVDADDWINEETVEIAINQIIKEKADILFWDFVVEKESAFSQSIINEQTGVKYSNGGIVYLQKCMMGGIPSCPSAIQGAPWARIYLSQIIKDNAIYFNESLPRSQDNEFNFRYLECVKQALFLPIKMYHYRQYKGSATHKFNKNAIDIMHQFLSVLSEDINKVGRELFENELKYVTISKFADICRIYFAHPDNPNTIGQRINEMKSLFYKEPYYDSFTTYNAKECDRFLKIVFFLLSKERFAFVYFVFRIRFFLKRIGL